MRRMRPCIRLGSAALLVTLGATPAGTQQPGPTRNAISGRVTDPSGAPVAGALVTVVLRDERNGQARFHPADVRVRFTTDADGRYRMDSVPLGDCYVVVIPPNTALGPDRRPNRTGFRITYYPAAATAAEAMPVRVNVREPQIADVTLQPARLGVITGTVFTAAGTPANGGRLRVGLGDGLFGVGGGDVALDAKGRFALAGLAPGTYHLHYSEGVWPPPRDVEVPLVSGATVIMRDGDATNIRVMPIRMAHATGRVIVDAALRGQLRPGEFTVGSTPLDFDGNPGPARPGTLHDDLTFEFRAWPGRGRLRVIPEDRGWIVKAARYRGTDVTQTGIDFGAGEEISGIEVELVRRGG